jgi:hypothetical protein
MLPIDPEGLGVQMADRTPQRRPLGKFRHGLRAGDYRNLLLAKSSGAGEVNNRCLNHDCEDLNGVVAPAASFSSFAATGAGTDLMFGASDFLGDVRFSCCIDDLLGGGGREVVDMVSTITSKASVCFQVADQYIHMLTSAEQIKVHFDQTAPGSQETPGCPSHQGTPAFQLILTTAELQYTLDLLGERTFGQIPGWWEPAF